MKRTLIILNILAAIWMWAFSPAVRKGEKVSVHSKLRELEQAGIIVTNNVPTFLEGVVWVDGKNDPFALAAFLHHWRTTYDLFIFPAALIFLANGIMLMIFWKPTSKHEKIVQHAPPAGRGEAPRP